MVHTSHSVSGPHPDPEPPATPAPSGVAPETSAEVHRSAMDRRGSLAHAPSLSAEAELRVADERTLIELRRKVQSGELLSASTERLLWKMRFNGHLTVVVQNGRVLKSGYEEGYFRRRNDLGRLLIDA